MSNVEKQEPQPPPDEPDIPDILPPIANQIMAALWILLLGGRWIVGSLLISSGMVSAAQVAVWDSGLLAQLYLLLLVVTILVVALRALRASQAAHSSQSQASSPLSSVRRGKPRD